MLEALRGPVALLNVSDSGMPMGSSLGQWFVYLLFVGVFCAFMAYAMSLPQNSISYRRNRRMRMAAMCDGLVFALLTGGMFGWLWPR